MKDKKKQSEKVEQIKLDIDEDKSSNLDKDSKKDCKTSTNLENNTDNDSSTNSENVKENPKEEKKEHNKISKYVIYFILILAITGITLYFSLAEKDPNNNDKAIFWTVIDHFKTLNIPYFIYGCLCFIGVFLVNSLILFLFARRYKKKYYYHQALANDCIGNFFNCITPSSTGGQIMQAYTYKKQGVSISNATSCLVMNFIVYQGVMVICAIIALICKLDTVVSSADLQLFEINGVSVSLPVWVVAILGFALQVFVVGLILLASYSKKFHNFLLNHGINFLAKIRIIKDPDASRRRFSVQLESFKIELKNLFINPRFLILIVLLHFGSFLLRYSVPYFINESVINTVDTGTYIYSWWDTVCLTSIHKMATELIPIPGSAGVAEAFYATLFSPGFNVVDGTTASSFAAASQIIWRTITFHFPLIISGFVTAFYKGKPGKEEIRQVSEKGGITSYMTLQIETIDERKKTYDTYYTTQSLNKNEIDKWRKNKDKKKSKTKKEDIEQ